MTALITIAVIPVHLLFMINLFIKMNTSFHKQILQDRLTRRFRSRNDSDLEVEEEEEAKEEEDGLL